MINKSIDERGSVFIGGLMRMTKILRRAAVSSLTRIPHAALCFAVLLATAALVTTGCDMDGGEQTVPETTLVCLGDSLTAGYGAVEPKKEDRSKSYPAYLQEKVKMPVINKGVSGAFSAGGLSQINSILETDNPRILIIELGANDYLLGRLIGGVPVSETYENLQAIIDKANDGQRKIYLAKFYTEQVAKDLGVGDELIKQYDDMFDALASENDVELIADIWTGVWGIHMSDEHHPNAEGYKIMADNYFNAMKDYLEENGLVK
jgi:acyl-CoA thioesterase-1